MLLKYNVVTTIKRGDVFDLPSHSRRGGFVPRPIAILTYDDLIPAKQKIIVVPIVDIYEDELEGQDAIGRVQFIRDGRMHTILVDEVHFKDKKCFEGLTRTYALSESIMKECNVQLNAMLEPGCALDLDVLKLSADEKYWDNYYNAVDPSAIPVSAPEPKPIPQEPVTPETQTLKVFMFDEVKGFEKKELEVLKINDLEEKPEPNSDIEGMELAGKHVEEHKELAEKQKKTKAEQKKAESLKEEKKVDSPKTEKKIEQPKKQEIIKEVEKKKIHAKIVLPSDPNYEFKEAYNKWKNGELSTTEAAKSLKLSKSTFYRRVADWEERHPKETPPLETVKDDGRILISSKRTEKKVTNEVKKDNDIVIVPTNGMTVYDLTVATGSDIGTINKMLFRASALNSYAQFDSLIPQWTCAKILSKLGVKHLAENNAEPKEKKVQTVKAEEPKKPKKVEPAPKPVVVKPEPKPAPVVEEQPKMNGKVKRDYIGKKLMLHQDFDEVAEMYFNREIHLMDAAELLGVTKYQFKYAYTPWKEKNHPPIIVDDIVIPAKPKKINKAKKIEDLDVIIVGGDDAWQKKMKAKFPNWEFVNANKRARMNNVNVNYDIIYICDRHVSHSVSCVYEDKARKNNKTVLHITKTNIDDNVNMIYEDAKLMNLI